MTDRLPRALKKMNYRQPIHCRWCKHCDTKKMACGSQSFMVIQTCRKVEEQVAADGTCDQAERHS